MDKPKFNFIDVLIILAAALVICAAVLFLSGRSGGADTQTVGVEYEIHITQVSKSVADLFDKAAKNGETATVSDKERISAELKGIKVEPAKRLSTDAENGEVFWADIEGYYDLTLSLHSDGSETPTEICVGATPIRVGDTVGVKVKGAGGYGYVTALDTVK